MNSLSLTQAARELAVLTEAPAPHPATMNRWCGKGILGPNGDRIVLASKRRGRMRFTSKSAVRDFFEATNSPTHADSESELASDGC